MQSASELMGLLEYIGTSASIDMGADAIFSEIETVKRLPQNIVEVTLVDDKKQRQTTRYRTFEHSCTEDDVCLIGVEALKQ